MTKMSTLLFNVWTKLGNYSLERLLNIVYSLGPKLNSCGIYSWVTADVNKVTVQFIHRGNDFGNFTSPRL